MVRSLQTRVARGGRWVGELGQDGGGPDGGGGTVGQRMGEMSGRRWVGAVGAVMRGCARERRRWDNGCIFPDSNKSRIDEEGRGP